VRYVIFHVEGGVGKNIMATAVVKAIKKQHPDREIVVVASHPPIFINSPYVYRIYGLGQTPYFYEDFIKDKDTLIFKTDPYLHEHFINKKIHCIESWCVQNDIEYNGEKPEITLTEQEENEMSTMLSKWNMPIFLIQTHGGGDHQDFSQSWIRDIPNNLITPIIEAFQNEYKIIHLRYESQPAIPSVDFVSSPKIRDLCAIVKHSHNRVFMDSFAQHAAMAFEKKSTVIWPVDKSSQLGYQFHRNIVSEYTPNKTHLIDYYLSEDDIIGQPHMCPFPRGEKIFDENKVIESIKSTDESANFVPYSPPEKNQSIINEGCPSCPSENTLLEHCQQRDKEDETEDTYTMTDRTQVFVDGIKEGGVNPYENMTGPVN